jgi:serine/threonine-protein kinase
MDGDRNVRDSFLEAAALGLLATATLYVTPLEIAGRLDRWLYDAWSEIAPPAAPNDILLVRVEDPDMLEAIATLARGEHAKLLITTQPQAIAAKQQDGFVLGPVAVPAGDTRVRATDWHEGGHLLFEPDMDGVVRNDGPVDAEGSSVPSLALRAAEQLSESEPGKWSTSAPGSAPKGDRRWLRFYSARAFTELTASEVLADPTRLRDKILIAGGTAQAELTPLGPLSTHTLLAHAIAGYLQGLSINAGWVGVTAAWTLAASLIVAFGLLLPARSRAVACATPVVVALGMLAIGTLLFGAASVWLPVTGPVAWVLLAGGVLAVRAPPAKAARAIDGDLVSARRAAASGDFTEAWSRYRQISPTPALLPELYSLACELDSGGLDRHAADLFHRIAQVDGQYRDVARRLVRSTHPQPAGPLERDSMPATMGRYQLLEPIGRGAMGYVYLGRDPKINRIVALKAVDLAAEFEPSELEQASKNFLREAEIAGRLSHPNIVTIYDVGESDGIAYIAMEYLKGRHLSEFVSAERLLPVATVLDLLSRTADALDYAHAQNVVHRDIKPANIMYDSISDGLKITDFGIARLIDVGRTRTGIVLGTPAFMSPEQLEGKNVNGHTDLFALGVSLYQLLTGHLPFRGASMTKLMFVIANEPHQSVTAVRSDLPGCLNSIVDRALAKDPADRFQSGAEMAAALRGAAQAV